MHQQHLYLCVLQSTHTSQLFNIFFMLHTSSSHSKLWLMISSNMSEHVALVFSLLWAVWALELWIFPTFESNVSKKCPLHSVTLETVWTLVSFKTWRSAIRPPLKVRRMFSVEDLLSHFPGKCAYFLLLPPQMIHSWNKNKNLVLHQHQFSWNRQKSLKLKYYNCDKLLE